MWLLEREEMELCTAALVLLRPDGSVRVCSAGHPPPLVVSGGRAEAWGPRGSILGAFEETTWEVEERCSPRASRSSSTRMGSSSYPEATAGSARRGWPSVFDGVADPEGAVREAHSSLLEFAGGRFTDDMALVVLEREP